MSDFLTNAEADCLSYAARYALNRPATVAALTVVDEVIRLWPRLRLWQRKQMHTEILNTHPRPRLWQRVLDLDSEAP